LLTIINGKRTGLKKGTPKTRRFALSCAARDLSEELMQRIVVMVLVLLVATSAVAQSSRRHSRKPQPPPESPHMSSAKQSVEMKKMTDTFAGMWKTTSTIEKSEFFPMSGTASGRSDFRSGPAGNSLIERARSHGVMGVFAGLGVFWWDEKAAAYRGLWCDSLAPGGCDALGTGHWDGDALVFVSAVDMGGSKMQMKETYSDIKADSFTFTMETAMGDAPMTKMMTIQYQREQPKTTVPTPSE
jgi:hypothetical protein